MTGRQTDHGGYFVDQGGYMLRCSVGARVVRFPNQLASQVRRGPCLMDDLQLII